MEGEKQLGKILFLYESDVIELDKQELLEFLTLKTLRNLSCRKFYNSTLKAFYLDAYDFILKHLNGSVAIKVYQDHAIRLYSASDCDSEHNIFYMYDLNFTTSIVFEDSEFCKNKLTSEMIEELITYARVGQIK